MKISPVSNRNNRANFASKLPNKNFACSLIHTERRDFWPDFAEMCLKEQATTGQPLVERLKNALGKINEFGDSWILMLRHFKDKKHKNEDVYEFAVFENPYWGKSYQRTQMIKEGKNANEYIRVFQTSAQNTTYVCETEKDSPLLHGLNATTPATAMLEVLEKIATPFSPIHEKIYGTKNVMSSENLIKGFREKG